PGKKMGAGENEPVQCAPTGTLGTLACRRRFLLPAAWLQLFIYLCSFFASCFSSVLSVASVIHPWIVFELSLAASASDVGFRS
ncbi:MAG TPA: hypothetical protein VFV71_12470, partial [Burkholderiales bacterium]|nr:hypothetical protein [Burkholderiales bacterium]